MCNNMRCIHIITTFLVARPSSLILFMHLYGRVEYETFSCRAQIHSNGKSIFSHAPKAIERLCVLFLAVAASPRLPDHFRPNNARARQNFSYRTPVQIRQQHRLMFSPCSVAEHVHRHTLSAKRRGRRWSELLKTKQQFHKPGKPTKTG